MITIKDLQNAGKVINIVSLCTSAGLKPMTICQNKPFDWTDGNRIGSTWSRAAETWDYV